MRRFELVVVAAVVVGCGGTELRPATSQRGETCRSHELAIDVAGTSRHSLLHIPAASASPMPLVIMLHGGGGTGLVMQRYTRMDEVADANGFAVAYPDGTEGPGGGNTWNGGDCCGAAMRQAADDVGFLRGLIARLVSDGCVDPARVYVTGISNGGIMAYRMACEASDVIAAIAPIAGAPMVPCTPSRPVSVLVFHGTADHAVPIEGGFNRRSEPRRAFPPLLTTIQEWTALDRCTGPGDPTFQRGDTTCVSFAPCDAGSELAVCEIDGGGHTWPGAPAVLQNMLGKTTKDISANEYMWRFFAAHPAPLGGSR